jgi:hypothetical protein
MSNPEIEKAKTTADEAAKVAAALTDFATKISKRQNVLPFGKDTPEARLNAFSSFLLHSTWLEEVIDLVRKETAAIICARTAAYDLDKVGQEIALAALTEADAVHAANLTQIEEKLTQVETRFQFHRTSSTDSIEATRSQVQSLESRLTDIERRRIKTRLLKWLHGISRFHRGSSN